MAETSKDAEAAFDAFIAAYQLKYDKAAQCLARIARPCSHSTISLRTLETLRTSNPIESTLPRAAPHDPLEGLPVE